MEQFETEEQQVEAIKRFWKENGVAIIAGAVLGLGGLWGWRYYTDMQLESKEVASSGYQQAVEKVVETNTSDALLTFAKETDQAGYKAISELVLAQQAIDKNDLAGAAEMLEKVLSGQTDTPLSQVAALRLARVQLELKEFNLALATLEKVTSESFKAEALGMKGDAYTQLAQFGDARQSYIAALELAPQNQLIQMKLDNLAVAGA